jgi:hypothetical protein
MRHFALPAALLVLLLLLSATLGPCFGSHPVPNPPELNATLFGTPQPDQAALRFPVELSPSSSNSATGDEPDFSFAFPAAAPAAANTTPITHGIVYDDGWILRPLNAQQTPFELKFSFHNQFRYTGFANQESAVINSAGATVPTPPRNDYDINRGRLIFSGYAIDQ